MTDVCLRNGTIIVGSLTFSLFSLAYDHNLSCGPSTYLRPEKGGAIIPWPYLTVLVVLHAPVLWQRITHWENVQMVALALAVFSVATTVVGYWSTALEVDQVLVWMPLQLLLDNGAMSQLYLLIRAKDRRFGSVWNTAWNTHKPWKLLWSVQGRLDINARNKREREKRAWVAVLAFLIFLAMLLLQIFGFGYAIKGLAQRFHANDLNVPWCSPFLQNYVVAVYDKGIINTQTNCPDFQSPTMDSNRGIGCLNLKAKRQMDFLWVTVVILPLSIVLEVVDFWRLRQPYAEERQAGENLVVAENAREDDAEEEHFDARPWWTVSCRFLSL
jgi:hypothetical protein